MLADHSPGKLLGVPGALHVLTSAQRAERRAAVQPGEPVYRFDLAHSSGATGLDLDEQNAAYVPVPRLSTVAAVMPRGFQLAGSGAGRLPGRPGHSNARS